MILPKTIMLVEKSHDLPFSMDEIKIFLRIDGNESNYAIESYARYAIDQCEHYTVQAVMKQRWRFSYVRPSDASHIELFITPARKVVLCNMIDRRGNITEYNLEYIKMNDNAVTLNPTPLCYKLVLEYIAGFVTEEDDMLPDGLKGAIFNHISCLYDGHKEFDIREYDLYKNKWLG